MVVRSVYLPVELIETILSKSPIKSLLRFKSVSKRWHPMISDPRFSRIHRIQRSKLSENQNMLVAWMSSPIPENQLPDITNTRICLIVRMEDGKLRTVLSELADDHQSSKHYSTFTCSCNGIFLLIDLHHCYQLWNPSIRKYSTMIIPEFSDRSPLKCDLYHDARSDDYKIVIIFDDHYRVYSCKNQSWGDMAYLPFDVRLVIFGCVLLDGRLYFSRKGEIVFFNFRDGKLYKFPQPNYDHDHVEEEGFDVVQALKAISGRLCLLSYTYDKTSVLLPSTFELWVMERNENLEHCWKKIISMDNKDKTWLFESLCLSNEDNNVVIGRIGNESKLSLYNCGEKVFQKIEFDWSGQLQFFQCQENFYIPA